MRFQDHPAVQRRDMFQVDPRKLKVDPNFNVRGMDSRETRDHIAGLKASIIANGVKVPLEVRMGERDQIFIVSGHCRHVAVLEAIKEGAEIATVPCILEKQSTNEIDRTVNLIVANSGKPLAPLEVAAVVKRLDDYGWNPKQIAERLGWKSTNTVKQHLEMVALPEDAKKKVREGKVSATTARQMAKGVDRETAERLWKENEEENRKIMGKGGRTKKLTPRKVRQAKEAAKPRPEAKSDSASQPQVPTPEPASTDPYSAALDAWKRCGGLRPEKRPDGIPTRSDQQWMTQAEMAISGAMAAVEKAGASEALTDAVTLLSKARDRVADHVEGVNP